MTIVKQMTAAACAALMFVLSGCGQAPTTETPTPTASSPSPTQSASATPSEEPSASPVRPSSPSVRPPRPAAPPAAPVAPAPAPAPPAAPDLPTAGRACEDGLERVDELGALGTDCETARRVAAAVDVKILALGEIPDEPFSAVEGWTCAKDGAQMEEFTYLSCDKGDRRMLSVTFGWGA